MDWILSYGLPLCPLRLTYQHQIRNHVMEFPLLAETNALKQHVAETSVITVSWTGQLSTSSWLIFFVSFLHLVDYLPKIDCTHIVLEH